MLRLKNKPKRKQTKKKNQNAKTQKNKKIFVADVNLRCSSNIMCTGHSMGLLRMLLIGTSFLRPHRMSLLITPRRRYSIWRGISAHHIQIPAVSSNLLCWNRARILPLGTSILICYSGTNLISLTFFWVFL